MTVFLAIVTGIRVLSSIIGRCRIGGPVGLAIMPPIDLAKHVPKLNEIDRTKFVSRLIEPIGVAARHPLARDASPNAEGHPLVVETEWIVGCRYRYRHRYDDRGRDKKHVSKLRLHLFCLLYESRESVRNPTLDVGRRIAERSTTDTSPDFLCFHCTWNGNFEAILVQKVANLGR